MSVDFWDDEKKAKLTLLLNQGLSASQIGDRIGATRNAVIGKAHRMGLVTKGASVKPRSPPKNPNPPRYVVVKIPKPPKPLVPVVKKEGIKKEGIKGVRVVRIGPHAGFIDTLRDYSQCRYPVGERGGRTLFCGEPTEFGESWCDHCAGIVWEPRRKRA